MPKPNKQKKSSLKLSYNKEQSGQTDDIFRFINDQVADGIFTVNLQGYILYANKAAENIVCVPYHKAVGTHFSKYVEKGSLVQALRAFQKAKKGKATVRHELNIITTKNEIIPVEFTASPIYKDSKIVQIHAIIQDISQKRKIESLLKESEKMHAAQHFIIGAAQEIKYPLKGLFEQTQGFLEEYKSRDFEYIGYKEYKDIFERLERMKSQIKYCYDTINRLLYLSRKKIGVSKEKCDVSHSLKEAIKLVEHQMLTADIQVKLSLAKNLPKVFMSPSDFQQIILNLLTNSIQAMPAGGVITIRTKYLKEKNAVKIDCKDEGVGISKEILKRVYEPFFTTKQRGLQKSTGLGLSIVYSIIKSHNGEIKIISSLRSGTCVEIILPLSKSK